MYWGITGEMVLISSQRGKGNSTSYKNGNKIWAQKRFPAANDASVGQGPSSEESSSAGTAQTCLGTVLSSLL